MSMPLNELPKGALQVEDKAAGSSGTLRCITCGITYVNNLVKFPTMLYSDGMGNRLVLDICPHCYERYHNGSFETGKRNP